MEMENFDGLKDILVIRVLRRGDGYVFVHGDFNGMIEHGLSPPVHGTASGMLFPCGNGTKEDAIEYITGQLRVAMGIEE